MRYSGQNLTCHLQLDHLYHCLGHQIQRNLDSVTWNNCEKSYIAIFRTGIIYKWQLKPYVTKADRPQWAYHMSSVFFNL